MPSATEDPPLCGVPDMVRILRLRGGGQAVRPDSHSELDRGPGYAGVGGE